MNSNPQWPVLARKAGLAGLIMCSLAGVAVAQVKPGGGLPAMAATAPASAQADVAERMERAQRVAADPLRRIQEAARLGGGPARSAAPAAAPSPAAGGGTPAQATQAAVAKKPAAAPATASTAGATATASATVAAPDAAVAAAAATAPVALPAAVPPGATRLPGHAAAADAAVAAPAARSDGPPEASRVADMPAVAERDGAALPVQAVAALAPPVTGPAARPSAQALAAPTAAVSAGAGAAPGVPQLLEMVQPELGPFAAREGGTMRFQLRFSIAADGSVQDIVVEGVSDRALQRAVRQAVSRWRYAPPERPMPHKVDLVVRFDT